MQFTIPKGTFDILPQESKAGDRWKEVSRWAYLENVMRTLSHNYGYQEIRTPIFEPTELFTRGVGETSDIVSKEMYTFLDKGERSMSLRPEGTASVMRAFVHNGLKQFGAIQKFFYIGPFFRYDRPQAGRYRQFHQFGAEAIGTDDPEQDFEVIDMLVELYKRLGLKDLHVMLNTLGGPECRGKYKEALLAFLAPHLGTLSLESQQRFEKNPLRILDSKDPSEQALLANGPEILDFLDDASRKRFDTLCNLLEKRGVPFSITPKLVRGLDYYNQTVFEVTSSALGAQNTIGAGGRYDGLLSLVGGPDLPAIGFSTGIERILHTLEKQGCKLPEGKGPFAAFIPLSKEAKETCLSLVYKLRHEEISAELSPTMKIQKGLQAAEKQRAQFAIIIGEDELNQGKAQLKNMETRESSHIPIESLVTDLKGKWSRHGL